MSARCLMWLAAGGIALLVAGCASDRATPWDTLATEVKSARVFFPDVVSDPSTQQWVFAFSPDGRTLFYASDEPRRIVKQTWTAGRWTPAQSVDDSSADRDGGPFVSPDGAYLYFSSWRDGRSRDLYRQRLNPPGHVERLTSTDEYGEVSLSLTRDDTGFVWTSGRADGSPGIGFYAVCVSDGRVSLTADASTLHRDEVSGENTPFIDPDGRFVIFANYDITPGTQEDLFVSFIDSDGPGPPVSLGGVVNSPFNDTAPYVTPDGRFLLFSSDRPTTEEGEAGDYQIWWIPTAEVSALAPVSRRGLHQTLRSGAE